MKEVEDIAWGELEQIAIKTKEAILNPKNEGRRVAEIKKEIFEKFDINPYDERIWYLCKGFSMAYYELILRYEGRIF